MPQQSRQNPSVRDFILRNVRAHPVDIAAFSARECGLSRVAISGYLRRLTQEGLLSAKGNTKARRYGEVPLAHVVFKNQLFQGILEDAVWRFRVLPKINGLTQNIVDICQYGFTEIYNNAIDHSASPIATVSFNQTYSFVTLLIMDQGVGIFHKIQNDFRLDDPRQALLELSKGRLTSDQKNHSGQGIFFTSRMFEEFSIRSGELFYRRVRKTDNDWLIESEALKTSQQGTWVSMTISTNAPWTTREIFDRYQVDPVGFTKTHVPIALGKYPGEQLV
ncbi:MAG TPA: hypothetical protein VGP42_10810, partial [Stellaceae bacterium]|nr:hypothetical protein [Stellaceae bacterium]